MYMKTSLCVPSGEVMVEESGVPVQDDWSMAPDEDRVRFSLSGVTPLCETANGGKRGARSATWLFRRATRKHNEHKSTTCRKMCTHTHTHLLLVHSEFVATGFRFTARFLILFLRKH